MSRRMHFANSVFVGGSLAIVTGSQQSCCQHSKCRDQTRRSIPTLRTVSCHISATDRSCKAVQSDAIIPVLRLLPGVPSSGSLGTGAWAPQCHQEAKAHLWAPTQISVMHQQQSAIIVPSFIQKQNRKGSESMLASCSEESRACVGCQAPSLASWNRQGHSFIQFAESKLRPGLARGEATQHAMPYTT